MTASHHKNDRLVSNGHYHKCSHRASNSVASQRKCASPHRKCSRVATGAPHPSHADARQLDADASRREPTHARAQARTHARRKVRLAV